MTSETIFEIEDIVWLGRSLSLSHLMMPKHALTTLRKHASDLEAMPTNGVLSDDTPVETLITADGYLQCLSAWETDLRDDLLIRNNHLELLTLGGLLVLLAPQEGDLAVLGHSRRRGGGESWIVDLAHRSAASEPINDLSEHLALIQFIGRALAGHNRPKPRLWRCKDIPSDAIAALQAETRAIYREQGTDAAHAHLSAAMNAPDSGALGQYLKDRSARRA